MWDEALTHINHQGNRIINDIRVVSPPKDSALLYWFNSATTTRIGKDLYFGTGVGWWTGGKAIDRFAQSSCGS